MRLLIVDDSEDARDVLLAALADGGYDNVIAVGSGPDALAALGAGGDLPAALFDLVLLDIVMPGMDGIEACARIREDDRLQDMPVIIVTHLDDNASLTQAFVAGANDYLTKPVRQVELLVRVRNALRLKAELERRLKGPASPEAFDAKRGFLTRYGLEGLLSSDQVEIGGVGILQVDGWQARAERHEALDTRLHATLALTSAPLGSLVCAYEPGQVAVAFPPISEAEAVRILDHIRQSLAEPRDATRDPVGVCGAYAACDPALGAEGRRKALAEAQAALLRAAAEGEDRLVLAHAPSP